MCVFSDGAGVMGGVEGVIIYVFGLKDLEQLATHAVIKHIPIHSYSVIIDSLHFKILDL